MSKKPEGRTIIIRDKDGKEIERMEDVDKYMVIWEGNKRMDVKAWCNMQWAAYAIKVADTNLNNSLQQAQVQKAMAQQQQQQQGVQIAKDMPQGFPGSLKQMRSQP